MSLGQIYRVLKSYLGAITLAATGLTGCAAPSNSPPPFTPNAPSASGCVGLDQWIVAYDSSGGTLKVTVGSTTGEIGGASQKGTAVSLTSLDGKTFAAAQQLYAACIAYNNNKSDPRLEATYGYWRDALYENITGHSPVSPTPASSSVSAPVPADQPNLPDKTDRSETLGDPPTPPKVRSTDPSAARVDIRPDAVSLLPFIAHNKAIDPVLAAGQVRLCLPNEVREQNWLRNITGSHATYNTTQPGRLVVKLIGRGVEQDFQPMRRSCSVKGKPGSVFLAFAPFPAMYSLRFYLRVDFFDRLFYYPVDYTYAIIHN